MANMNSMLPTYQGNYKDMIGALKYGDIQNPCWFWIEDREVLSFIHWEKDAEGNKILVPHVMLWENIENLNTQVNNLSEQLKGMDDPETGEPVNIVTYVTENVAPVQEKVIEVTQQATETQSQVEKLSNAITMITSADLDEEVTE